MSEKLLDVKNLVTPTFAKSYKPFSIAKSIFFFMFCGVPSNATAILWFVKSILYCFKTSYIGSNFSDFETVRKLGYSLIMFESIPNLLILSTISITSIALFWVTDNNVLHLVNMSNPIP